MTQQDEVLMYADPKTRFDRLSEAEKLLNTVEGLKMSAETMSAKARELNKLFEETQRKLADTRSLRVKLNTLATMFGLEPIAVRKTRR